VGFKKHAPWALRGIQKFAMKEMGTPDVPIDTRLNKTLWVKGIRKVLYCILLCPENVMRMRVHQTNSTHW
jgi:large subunit ribosomal protein L31e